MTQYESDRELAEALEAFRRCDVRVHVRGTDAASVVEFRDKRSGRVVGGKEMRRRLSVVFQ